MYLHGSPVISIVVCGIKSYKKHIVVYTNGCYSLYKKTVQYTDFLIIESSGLLKFIFRKFLKRGS